MSGQFKAALSFLTRIPTAAPTGWPPGGFAGAVWCFPLIGIVIGALSAAGALLAGHFGLPPMLVAIAALTVSLLVTGALHEDGLADTFDGFGGGQDPAGKLAIMSDSRIGTYGVLALLISFVGRASAISSLVPDGAGTVVLTLIAAHAASRAVLPALMGMLSPAKSVGLAAQAGKPGAVGVGVSLFIGTVVLMIALGGAGFAALLVIALVIALWCWIVRRQIGGYTGDTLGAAQQIVELVVLAVASGPV